jgi:hypothetical protein
MRIDGSHEVRTMSAAPNQPVGDGDVYGEDFPQLAEAQNAGYDMAVINGHKYPLSVVVNVLLVIYEMLADPHTRAILVWAIEIIEARGTTPVEHDPRFAQYRTMLRKNGLIISNPSGPGVQFVPEFHDMIRLIERQVSLYDRLVDNLIARQSHDFRLPLRLSWYNSRTGTYSDIADKDDSEFLISSSLVRFAESMSW